MHRREGRYLLRSNLTQTDPGQVWEFYLQLVEVVHRRMTRGTSHGLVPLPTPGPRRGRGDQEAILDFFPERVDLGGEVGALARASK